MSKEKYEEIPTPKERAEIAKERTLSDAGLIGEGADPVMNEGDKEPILEITEEQLREKKREMYADIGEKQAEISHTEKIKQRIQNQNIQAGDRVNVSFRNGPSWEGEYLGESKYVNDSIEIRFFGLSYGFDRKDVSYDELTDIEKV